MAHRAITDKAIRGAVDRAVKLKRRVALTVGGAATPGLQFRAHPSGTVSYALRYRTEGGRQRNIIYEAASLADARAHAKDLLAKARRAAVGTEADPWQAKQEAKVAEQAKRKATDRTLARIVKAWLSSRESNEWRAGTRYQFQRITSKNILPVLGERDPNTIERGEVRRLIDDIADGVGRKRGPAPREASHTLATLRLIYNWCAEERQEHLGVTAQPCTKLKAVPLVPRDRVYSNAEIRRIFAAVDEGPVSDLVGLLFHTGTRDEETRGMCWKDLDTERGVWVIPGDVSKNAKPHEVALSSGALAILERIKGRKITTLSPFVFPAETETGYMGRPLSSTFQTVAIKAGLVRNIGTKDKPRYEGDNLRLHDVRRTVGDRLKAEYGPAVMHAALGHAELTLTRTYGPTPPLKMLAAAMQWWSSELAKILQAKREEAVR